MGICSASSQNKKQQNIIDIPNKQSPQTENTQENQRIVHSEQNIQTRKLDCSPPSRFVGQSKFAGSPSSRQIKQIVWADNIVENSQYRGTLKSWIALKNAQFSKCYSILNREQSQKLNIKTKESMALVQHNLSGKMRVALIIRKNSMGQQLIDGIIKSQLVHPNLLRVFEIYQDNNHYQVIHDFCNGGSLQHQSGVSVYTEQQAALVLKQIIEVMQYIHQYDLNHCCLSLSSFQKCNQSNSHYIKLVEFQSLFTKQAKVNKNSLFYLSPEAINFQDIYSKERDIWSVGIILFKLLTGKFPFNGQNKEEMLEQMNNYAITGNFGTTELPPQSGNTIKSFLQIDPSKRIKLNDALNDRWLKYNISQSQAEMDQIMKQLDNNHKISFLQCCYIQFMITTFNSDQEQNLYTIFRQFDLNHDGKINRQELTQIYMSHFSTLQEVKEHVDLVFKIMDIDKNGEIDFQEFLIGAIDRKILVTEDNLIEAFKILSDIEGNITLQKMCSIYPNKKQQLKQQFSGYENNQINFKQFKELMHDSI